MKCEENIMTERKMTASEKASATLEFFSTADPVDVSRWTNEQVIAHFYQAARMGSFSEDLFGVFSNLDSDDQNAFAADIREIARESIR